jgi:glycosyltransferase involved in cell wall biosynthesis
MTISVLGLQPRYFIRPKNTDWRQNRFLEIEFLNRKAKGEGVIAFELRRSILSFISMNGRYLRNPLGRYIKFINEAPQFFVSIFDSDKEKSFDVIYSYDCYPDNATKPVVWHTGPTDTSLLARRGVPSEIIHQELNAKEISAKKATLIVVSSEIAKSEFNRQFPGHHQKLLVLPFVLPGVDPVSTDYVYTKQRESEGLNILFVGRQARLKGLDLVIAAFNQLRVSSKVPLTLTIVSNLCDGPVDIPKSNDVVWHRTLDHSAIQGLMRQSHILVMPSREESYGLVYLESMAAGAVPIAPNREPQISLLGNGSRGLLCEVSIEGVFNALTELITNQESRKKMALNGLSEYRKSFAVDGVITRYEEAFVRASQ